MENSNAAPTTNGGFAIGAVSRLTGVSVHTLRVWERRHGAVSVERSAGGRRIYSQADVDRLMLIKQLVDRGETISQVAALPLKQLQQRVAEFSRHVGQRREAARGFHRIAAFGDFLGLKLQDCIGPAEIVAQNTDLQRFTAEIRKTSPQVLVLDLPIVNEAVRKTVAELRQASAAEYVVAIYGFGRSEDVRLLGNDADALLRTPIQPSELRRVLVQLPAVTPDTRSRAEQNGPAPSVTALATGDAPGRRFSRNQLARLAAAQPEVECECPAHLVEIVDRLSVFEDYSADCEHRNPEDAALHGFLHISTAHARALMEAALARVAEAEGIDPGPA